MEVGRLRWGGVQWVGVLWTVTLLVAAMSVHIYISVNCAVSNYPVPPTTASTDDTIQNNLHIYFIANPDTSITEVKVYSSSR